MKSNVKLNKLFNLNNMFTLLLIVILILVIVCCVRKNKSNKENFLDWSPLTCNEKGETDWESKQHFGDVRCLDGEYGSAGASNDARAKALGGFLEFTADSEQGDLKDFIGITSQVMSTLDATVEILYQVFTRNIRRYPPGTTNGDNILQKFYELTGVNDEINTDLHKTNSLNKLKELIKGNILDSDTKESICDGSYFNDIGIVEYTDPNDVTKTITVKSQKNKLKNKYCWRTKTGRDSLLVKKETVEEDENGKQKIVQDDWDDQSAIIAFMNELHITKIIEKQNIDNGKEVRAETAPG